MKRFLIFLCACSLMTTGKAQKIKAGFHLGTNISGYTGGKHYIVYDKSSKLGLEMGADIKYLLKNRISVYCRGQIYYRLVEIFLL